MRYLVVSRWFALADLVCVSVSCVLWELEPRLGLFPLLIALLPWLLRLVAGRFPFQRTRFDIPIFIFILTAAVGIWTAYNHENAWAKFWLIISGVLLYYALAGQPKENLWAITGHLSIIGVGQACFFLFTNNWQTYPAKIGFLNQIGLWWMKVRPATDIVGTHPNNAAGVMGFILPFLIAIGIRAWQEKRVLSGIWAVIGGLLICLAFLMATSRGASLALMAGLGIWFLWGLSNQATRFIHSQPKEIFYVACILSAFLITGFVFIFPGGPVALANSFPGPSVAMSRLELENSAIKLMGDFPITGAGLSTFPGLFSQYIYNTPIYLILNSHNIYLDVALEQSFIGLLAFSVIYLGSVWLAVTAGVRNPGALLVWASLAGLVVAILHGLVDNVLYGPNDAPFLFLLPGLAYAMTKPYSQAKTRWWSIGNFIKNTRSKLTIFLASAMVIVTCLALAYQYRKPILAAWYANLGSIRLAQVDLANFPSNKWDEGQNLGRFTESKRYFLTALTYEPHNRTANHRLGLIATIEKDFSSGIMYLEKAYQADNKHRGIWKALGYCYAWSGKIDQSIRFLEKIPEARQELDAYISWWQIQGRNDLAEQAMTTAHLLSSLDP